MSEHTVTVDWKRETPDFAYETYNRDHAWSFDAGVTVRASANPAYLGSETCVDPEAALVSGLSSCHMLTFLSIAAPKRYVVDGYNDEARRLEILPSRDRRVMANAFSVTASRSPSTPTPVS
jgi:organic hydroperoxide reductase OsmC/OhrA